MRFCCAPEHLLALVGEQRQVGRVLDQQLADRRALRRARGRSRPGRSPGRRRGRRAARAVRRRDRRRAGPRPAARRGVKSCCECVHAGVSAGRCLDLTTVRFAARPADYPFIGRVPRAPRASAQQPRRRGPRRLHARRARRPGRAEAMKPAIGILVFGYWDSLVNRARLKLPEADAEDVAGGGGRERDRVGLRRALGRRVPVVAAHDPEPPHRRLLRGARAPPQDRASLSSEQRRGPSRPQDDALFATQCLEQAYDEIANERHRRVIDLYVFGELQRGEDGRRAGRRHERGERPPDRLAVPEALRRAVRRGRYSGLGDGDVERLLTEYKAAHRAGADADPRPFLERAERRSRACAARGADRRLSRRAPRRRDFDAAAFRDSAAAPVAESVQRSLAGAGRAVAGAAAAPAQPRTRAPRRPGRRAGGAAGRRAASRTRSASYYHQMEQGLLPEAGVSDAVLEALGRIVGVLAGGAAQGGADARGGRAVGCACRSSRVFTRIDAGRRRRASGAGRAAPLRPTGLGRGRPPLPRRLSVSPAARPPTSPACTSDSSSVYRFALRTGDRPLARRLGRALRGDPALRSAGRPVAARAAARPARWSAAGERIVRRVMDRIGS